MSNKPAGPTFIIISLLVAMMLTVMPMPAFAMWFRPAWVALVVSYWVMQQRIGPGIAWLAGLFLDVLVGTALGQHALALAVHAYLVSVAFRHVNALPLWQQALWIGSLLFVYQFILVLTQGLLTSQHQPLVFWLPALTSMLLWPWVWHIFTDIEERLGERA